jgi:uncharacterized membrane protein YtjA (UPF0391 family)
MLRSAAPNLVTAEPSVAAMIENRRNNDERTEMLYYALVFFVIALIAALFGFGGIAAGAAGIAKVLFLIFLVLFVVSLIFGLVRRGRP